MKKNIVKIVCIVLLAALAVSCAPKAEPVAPAEPVTTAEAAFKISGIAEKSWTVDELKALPLTNTDYTNKDGETTTYSGVTFTALFEAAGVGDYSTVTLMAADGYTSDVSKNELSACTMCIVAIEENGSLRSVMPDLSGKQNVKDLVEIQVK